MLPSHLQVAHVDLLKDVRRDPGLKEEPASKVDTSDLAVGALLSKHCLRPITRENLIRKKCAARTLVTLQLNSILPSQHKLQFPGLAFTLLIVMRSRKLASNA